MHAKRYDVIIIGGRVAGASTALLLARAGLRVLVVDRARYGSDTLSTHALLRGGVEQLARWGLLDEVIATGTPPVRRTVVRYGAREDVVEIAPGQGYAALYAPRRTVLDRILVDAAFRAGAEVRFGTTLVGLTRGADGSVTGVTTRDAQGRTSTARAALVVGADGIRSTVARAVHASLTLETSAASAMAVARYRGVEADGYQWLYGYAAEGGGRSAGVIPTNGGEVCVWVGLPAAAFAARRPEQHLEATLAAIAPDWAARLRRGERQGPVRGFAGHPAFLRRAWGPGWALVGDAGYFKDPITAHGISDALHDAELLAGALVGAGDAARAPAALAAYQAARDRRALPLIRAAEQIATYDWPLEDLRELLVAISAALRATGTPPPAPAPPAPAVPAPAAPAHAPAASARSSAPAHAPAAVAGRDGGSEDDHAGGHRPRGIAATLG